MVRSILALLGATLNLLRALQANGGRALGRWTAAGVCAGVAMFAKYSAVLVIGGAWLYLIFSPIHRRWLVRPEPYVAVLAALAVFSPVLIWNMAHHWASFAFQGDRAAGFRLRPFMPLLTFGGEALFVLPWLWAPMMFLFIQGFQRKTGWMHRLLAYMAAPPVLGFALISTWSSQRILYHWAAPGYLLLFPLLGHAVADRIDRLWLRSLLAASASLLLVGVSVIVGQLQFDWLGCVFAFHNTSGSDQRGSGLDLGSDRFADPGPVAEGRRCCRFQLAGCRENRLCAGS